MAHIVTLAEYADQDKKIRPYESIHICDDLYVIVKSQDELTTKNIALHKNVRTWQPKTIEERVKYLAKKENGILSLIHDWDDDANFYVPVIDRRIITIQPHTIIKTYDDVEANMISDALYETLQERYQTKQEVSFKDAIVQYLDHPLEF